MPPTPLPTGWTARASRALLRLIGWQGVYAPLPGPKGVFIIYPHTSNWDFPLGVLYRQGAGIQAQWMGKDSLFRGLLGPLMRALGGIAIDRSAAQGLTAAIVDTYRRRDRLWLAITPEGTRSKVQHLKSGFYRIAVGATVPCGLAFIDYATRTVGVDTFVTFTGDEDRDLATLREYYAAKRGRHPALEGTIAFR
jgi:1-acyl-sn-glycerol-3-phosphate acyltransferase